MSLQLGKIKENILVIIESLRLAREDNVEVINDISYFEDHKTVRIDVIVKMLVILLNHALRSDTTKPIFIKFHIGANRIDISASYEYYLTDSDALQNMFDDDKLNVENGEQGHGFNHLSKLVRKFGGEVYLERDYIEKEKTSYLTISIKI